jgi:hypothetical protein
MPRGDTNNFLAANTGTGADLGTAPREMEQLMALAAQWGLEAGFLGIEGHLEPRMQALLEVSVNRLFGYFEAEHDRLMAEIDSAETAWDQAQQAITQYRSRYGTGPNGDRTGWLHRLRNWLWQTRDYRSAIAISRREAPNLRQLRLSIASVELTRRAANGWRETAAHGLRANFEFQQQRAVIARGRKEEHYNDDHNTKHFTARRAS